MIFVLLHTFSYILQKIEKNDYLEGSYNNILLFQVSKQQR